MPGIIVDKKHASTDCPLDHAYRICAEEGGIRRPSGQAAASRAAVYPFGYPTSVSLGSIIEPMQESVAAAEPEIAPNTAQVTTDTVPRPDFERPRKICTNPMSAPPIFPFP